MNNRSGRWPILLLANLVLWAAYFLAGRLGLLLALPPGYASPIFLPAGIALAACVAGGARLLPAVALGSLAVNLVMPALSPAGITRLAVMGALAPAVGAALQAWVGSTLFRRYIDPAIGSGRDVVRFILLAVSVTVVSSTVSLSGMLLLGILQRETVANDWLAWWMGDTIGILLAAPLTWILIGRPRALWARRRTLVGLPLLLSAAAFIAIYLQADRWENSQQLQTFRLKAQQTGDLLQAQFSEHERFIYAMAKALNDPRRSISPDDFSNLAHGYLDQRPELLSMGWLMPVAGSERPAFEAWARQQVDPGYSIRDIGRPGQPLIPAALRDRYFAVTFVEPAVARDYVGLDFLSEQRRRDALDRAIQSGQPTATAPLQFARTLPGTGLLLLQTVHPTGNHHQAVGSLLIAMQFEAYLNQALKRSEFPHFLLRFEDTDDDSPRRVVQDTLGRAVHAGDYQRQLHFGGRIYELTLAPTPAYLQQQRGWQSWTVLTCGLLLTGLLGTLMMLISGERARIQAEVKDSTSRLRQREARLQAILNKAADAILTIDGNGVLMSANAAAGRLFGYAPEKMTALPLDKLIPVGIGEAAGLDAAGLLRMIACGVTHEYELPGWRSDGSEFPLAMSVSEVELPDEHLFVAILHDLTEQHLAQERIHRLAHHDTLTGLANRLSLNLRLEQLLAQTRRSGGKAAVLFIDLDHFKKINDTHGHATGDLLLVAVSQRLQELLREVDTIARLGGDEFIVVTDGAITPDEASNIAVRIVDALTTPYHLQGKTVHSGASVGVAMFPDDGEDAGTLMRHADTAMYAAKSQGRGNFQFFSEDMNTATHERLMLENRLWQALEQNEFELYLQPQIELATQRIIGAEALLRWHHPELGMVGPDRFIPIAEESGLILPLGDWVLQRAISLLDSWRTPELAHLRLAVNLSARQCHGPGLLPHLDRLLHSQGVNPALLELEITESAAMQDPERSRALLVELRSRGIKVAIDDFGTGYSSLSYLKLFELDRIKIDRGFVKDIESDPDDAVIVAATIALAHSLGLEVIAEGVETEAQRDFLRAKQCDEAQGYLFARPMPVAQFEAMVRSATAVVAA
ncbi:PAS domain S-box-containing protein/diguanylate cyclase (GGDEF) domain-containing protein [Duganella sp. CF402]|uniref:EAL domain-containing protein n=1 Tax=unclassified Duganella TaxID=2636909 RepID=UPI0008B6D5F5|nr:MULTISPECIES: EAL domain-containing protein [unclassified Duganella]RZT05905.1 PAS domain S-box-containing protein/diguanylate cyclase (GGDEF)-like protein [Duganella sp. BK701]SEM80270.1 PAS domain S-box-containing protein/diguanylate cyclase (GGDEF) domain-containing protein [Duganella sp. CF402]